MMRNARGEAAGKAAASHHCPAGAGSCSGSIVLSAPPESNNPSVQGAGSVGFGGAAPCPCRVLFPFGLALPPWWPGGLTRASAEQRCAPGQRGASGNLAFRNFPQWSDAASGGFLDACASAWVLLQNLPSFSSHRSLGSLYDPWRPHLSDAQMTLVDRQLDVRARLGLRESLDHYLLSVDELRSEALRSSAVPRRLVLLFLSGNEAQFLAASQTRRARFCLWLRALETNSIPLVLFAGVELGLGGASAVAELGAAAPRKALQFKSRNRAARPVPQLTLLSILEEADSEVLLMRLAEGASHLAQLPPRPASTAASGTKDRNETGF